MRAHSKLFKTVREIAQNFVTQTREISGSMPNWPCYLQQHSNRRAQVYTISLDHWQSDLSDIALVYGYTIERKICSYSNHLKVDASIENQTGEFPKAMFMTFNGWGTAFSRLAEGHRFRSSSYCSPLDEHYGIGVSIPHLSECCAKITEFSSLLTLRLRCVGMKQSRPLMTCGFMVNCEKQNRKREIQMHFV